MEEVFYSQNVKTALKLAHVRGVALLAIAEARVTLGEYSPLEVKSSVVGYGRAEKQQVQLMVRTLTGLAEEIETDDVSDALAVAICHATYGSSPARKVAGARPMKLLVFSCIALATLASGGRCPKGDLLQNHSPAPTQPTC